MAPFLLILPLLASLRYLIQPIDGAIERRQSTKESDLVDPRARPKFIKDILAQTGGNALLPCQSNSPGIVTWTRQREKDRQLLTVGRGTHSIDTRFVIASGPGWNLMIKNVNHEDAGLYECQVTRNIHIENVLFRDIVTEAYRWIPVGQTSREGRATSLRLECQLMAAIESPSYVFWYREARMINYDNEPGVRFELRRNGSVLVVEKVKLSHGANYTCWPSNARPAHIMIHVIEEEEKPAAMHGAGDRRNSTAATSSNTILTLMAFLIIADVRRYLQIIIRYAT
ncbi:uncharacterized protein LOC105428798 [Pogonomyrmex barbatus]|uniref:Uncharacterized protein LOC105428798 n=1 Tax=Pogonomyrmex barbatus TaxID=144034 RepID=A0A6I9WJN0_9HYME|nr:uncharacterized protein LOC105428798 [Pogonomyrmex barbatus]